MKFHIKVLTPALAVEELVVEAATEDEARRLVANNGGRVIGLRAAGGLAGRTGKSTFNLSVFNQQMHSLLEAGQTVVDAVEVLTHNDRRAGNRAIYEVLLRELRQGNQLSDAMATLPSVFPTLYVAMVRSSETTGTVRASINRYMLYQRQVDEIRGKLAAAATYPAILLGVGFLVIAFLMLYVLPRFSAVYEDTGTMRNGSAGFVQWWGGFVRDNELLAWGGMAAFLAVLVTLVVHPAVRGAAYRRILTLPWLGERIQVMQLGRLYRTLGMLLTSGLSVLPAMRMTRASLPLAMHADLDRAIRSVSEGIPLSVAMSENNLTTEVAVRLLGAGESSGNLDEMMGRTADFYDQETAIWIDTAGRLI
jgi:general secretion pathway protein F